MYCGQTHIKLDMSSTQRTVVSVFILVNNFFYFQVLTITIIFWLECVSGNKKFFMGDKPTEVDCAIFGMLAQIYWLIPHSPLEKYIKGLCACML